MHFWGSALRLSEKACLSYNPTRPGLVFNSRYNYTGNNKKAVLLKWGLIIFFDIYVCFTDRKTIFSDYLRPKTSIQGTTYSIAQGRESQSGTELAGGAYTTLGQDNSF